MEETMVLLTSNQPESRKKGPEVKDKDQEQRCSDCAWEIHPLWSQQGRLIGLAVWSLENLALPEPSLSYKRWKVISSSLMEKAMAPHSSTLAWKIPWMEEPGRLQSMGLLRVRHDCATSLWLFTFMHWRRKWQPTPVFLPGESQGQGSLVSWHLWGCTESDMTEVT